MIKNYEAFAEMRALFYCQKRKRLRMGGRYERSRLYRFEKEARSGHVDR